MKNLCRILGVAGCFLCVSTSSASAHLNASLYPLRTHGPAAGKPSAQVELVDLKPVQLRPREAQSVTVMLNAAYSQGQMRVQVSAAEPLEVLGRSEERRVGKEGRSWT